MGLTAAWCFPQRARVRASGEGRFPGAPRAAPSPGPGTRRGRPSPHSSPPPTPNPASSGPASLASVHVLSRLWLSWLCAAPSARAVCRGAGGAVEGMAALQLEKGFFPGLSSSRCRPFLGGWFWGVGRFGEVWQRTFWTWWEGVEDVVSVSPPGHSTRAGCGSVVTRGRREWLPVDFIVLRFKCGLWYGSLHFFQGKKN